jgi:hypothetical protein
MDAESSAISLSQKVFDVQTKLVTHFNPAVGHQVPPSISSGLAPMITHFDLPAFQGGRLPTQSLGFHAPATE